MNKILTIFSILCASTMVQAQHYVPPQVDAVPAHDGQRQVYIYKPNMEYEPIIEDNDATYYLDPAMRRYLFPETDTANNPPAAQPVAPYAAVPTIPSQPTQPVPYYGQGYAQPTTPTAPPAYPTAPAAPAYPPIATQPSPTAQQVPLAPPSYPIYQDDNDASYVPPKGGSWFNDMDNNSYY